MGPVDRAFVFGIAPRPWRVGTAATGIEYSTGPGGWDGGMNHNDVAAAVAARAPSKIIPGMSLHPLAADVNDEYDRAVGDLGCKVIKLGPNYQDFDPAGDAASRLFARLENDGIPIIFHTGTSPMSDAPLLYAHPLTLDRVAMAFPKLKMVLAHLSHPWQVDSIAVVRKHPNVWADVSAQFYRPWSFWQGMRLFHEWGVTNKIFFGSDWPVVSCDPLLGIRCAVTGLSLDEEEFTPEHNITIEEALRAYTADAAYAIGGDDIGMLKPGMRGDLVMLDTDLMPSEWDPRVPGGPGGRVVLTAVGGDVRYDAREIS